MRVIKRVTQRSRQFIQFFRRKMVFKPFRLAVPFRLFVSGMFCQILLPQTVSPDDIHRHLAAFDPALVHQSALAADQRRIGQDRLLARVVASVR